MLKFRYNPNGGDFVRKNILLLPMLLIGLSLPTGALANNETVVINDGKIVNGRTLVPIRVISEELGSTVEWNEKLRTVTVNDGEKETVLTADSKRITINGQSSTIDVPAQIYNGRTFVPLVVASPTGSEVSWDQVKKQASISFNGKTVIVKVKRLVGLQGQEYVEGKYPIHWTYDLNEVKRYVDNHTDGEKTRSVFNQMSKDSFKQVEDEHSLTSEEWATVEKDIDTKLSILISLDVGNSDFKQATSLYVKFLQEAKEYKDYQRYRSVVSGIEFLNKEID